MARTKKVMAIHDLSGLGHSSLAAIIPILAVMGIQACPMPTAALSAQTDGYTGYSFADLTDFMPQYMEHWQKEAPKMDCVYSGFLASERQIDLVKTAMERFAAKDSLVVVDPVLGDDGALYDTMNEKMVKGMGELIKKADVITPNYTELLYLCHKPYREYPIEEIKNFVQHLTKQGAKRIVVTGIPLREKNQNAVLSYDRIRKEEDVYCYAMLPAHYPGSGDVFAAVLTGHLLNGKTLVQSARAAAQFVYRAIELTLQEAEAYREGLCLEKALPLLYQKNRISD